MALQTYRNKRNFSVTPEPRGEKGGKKTAQKGGRFVIQKHAARRLHYDLRLELDGAMKSWAVTRGPSLVPGEKRLAIHVEDHPIEYNKFEGTIPKGQYGGGTVMIWDRGKWIPEDDPHRGYAKGHLAFRLDGEKLSGGWHLVRMRQRKGEKQDPWLLIKMDDEAARKASAQDILEEEPRSVVTGRTIAEIAKNAPVKAQAAGKSARPSPRPRARAPKSAAHAKADNSREKKTPAKGLPGRSLKISGSAKGRLPDFVPPTLATLRAKPPAGANWLHEIKFDGYRIQARLDRGKVRLLTRNGLDWSKRFWPIADAAAELSADSALIDGEIVVEDESGKSNFSALQADLSEGRRDRFVYYVFDLLHLDGMDLTRSPLSERKRALEALLADVPSSGKVRLSESFEEDGATLLRHACRMHLEGIISKRADAPYRSGRSDDWVKAKCSDEQEFIVAGYGPSNVLKRGVGSLVVGYTEDGRLRYAGRVGTGFSQASSKTLWQRLQPLRVDKPPFGSLPVEEKRRPVQWVKPELVVEVDFGGWTGDRILRHAAFKGVREDKPVKEIVREVPKDTTSRNARNRAAAAVTPGSDVRLTHPDRVYWADAGITKQNLADYYSEAWDWIRPHLAGRPLALLRCPDGADGQCFFQKHASAGIEASHFQRVADRGNKDFLAINDLNGLIALVQAGVLEIHVWGSTVKDIDACDRIVFDLDPAPDVDWPRVIEAAREVRDRLKQRRLESFVKTTGGKGLHVVLPVDGADWDTAKAFAHGVARDMAADAPARFTVNMAKRTRTGRIFVDYLRNARGATSVVAYSTRARAGAPVSTPVRWDELSPRLPANYFTLLNLRKRLSALRSDPWADIGKIKQKLPPQKRGK